MEVADHRAAPTANEGRQCAIAGTLLTGNGRDCRASHAEAMIKLYLALTVSAALAAGGQVLLKLGATGQTTVLAMVNPQVLGGVTLYGIGMLIWLWALSLAQLQVVYPFTMLTLILVFVASVVIFGERPSGLIYLGWGVVGCGVAIVAYGGTSGG